MFRPRILAAATAAGFCTAVFACGSSALAQSAGAPKKATAGSPPAHAHGVAGLQLAADGNLLTLEFSSPLDNLVGFERAPRNDKEKAAVRRMAERLRKAETLFVPTPSARCSPTSIKLESPVLDASLLAVEGNQSPPSDQGARRAQKSSGAGEESTHASLSGEFVFRCEQPGSLRDLEVKLFDAFPDLRRLDVQVVGPKGQKAVKLSAGARRVTW